MSPQTLSSAQPKKRTKSKEIYDSLCRLIPGGVNSPVRAFKSLGMDPMVVDRASGAYVYDVDNNAYLDYCGSWGPLIYGHAYPEIVEAAQKRMAMGTTFGITSAIEEKLARLVVKHVPSVERIRFVSSGTEATMSVARLARGYTGRDLIVKFAGCYHGHADFFLVQAGSGVFGLSPTSTSAGIPEDIVKHTVCLPFNDVKATRDFLTNPSNSKRIAAVILEPIAGNMGCVPSTPEFLTMLRQETQKIGAVLIFDEVISGFRVGLGGAQAMYGITPDLSCFGKIIGAGFPAAAFGGKREIMEKLAPLGPVYQAGTLSGNPVAMEAGAKCLEMLERPGIYEELEEKANVITKPVQEYIEKKGINACIQQVGSMFTLFFGVSKVSSMDDAKKADLERFAHFFRYLFNKGVYIPPAQYETWFTCTAHEQVHLESTRDMILEYFSSEDRG